MFPTVQAAASIDPKKTSSLFKDDMFEALPPGSRTCRAERGSDAGATMTDIATRVYNHNWKIDPIVRSVLDTDFYKLLMAQTIFRRHRNARVTFGILNRATSVR